MTVTFNGDSTILDTLGAAVGASLIDAQSNALLAIRLSGSNTVTVHAIDAGHSKDCGTTQNFIRLLYAVIDCEVCIYKEVQKT